MCHSTKKMADCIRKKITNMLRKSKVILVTGHGGPLGCETLRLPHFLDSQLTDAGEVVSITHQLPFTPGRFLVLLFVRG
jgi:hypothetical protein